MEIFWYHWLILPLAGFIGMYSGGYWGIGCSWLIVPVMLLSGATPAEAAGVALLQMVPSVLPTVLRDIPKLGWESGSLGRGLLIPLALASLLFSIGGRPANDFLFAHCGDIAFRGFFMLIMIWLGLKIFFSRPVSYGSEIPRFGVERIPSAFVFGAICGFFSSLLGIGGGMLFRPLLGGFYKVPEKETANSVRFLLLITALAGGVSYLFANETIHWRMIVFAALVAAGGMIGFPYGVALHKKVYENGYAVHIHKSFAVIALMVVLNLILTMAGFLPAARICMVALAVLLSVYLVCFGRYTVMHPARHGSTNIVQINGQ